MLLSLVCAKCHSYSLKKKLHESLKNYSSDNDNRYVWFTRSIDDEIEDDLKSQQDIPEKILRRVFRKKSAVQKHRNKYNWIY